jgi:hypothetical protein
VGAAPRVVIQMQRLQVGMLRVPTLRVGFVLVQFCSNEYADISLGIIFGGRCSTDYKSRC